MKLFEIQEAYRNWCDKVESAEGEITAEDMAELEKIDGAMEEKAENIACLIKELSADKDALEEQEKRFKTRKQVKANEVERLKAFLTTIMQTCGKDKLETVQSAIAFRSSKAVEITDESALPSEYLRMTITPDKEAIKAALVSGKTVDGAALKENKNIQVR